jgi:hypothetical protein
MVYIRQKDHKISINGAVAWAMAFDFFWAFFFIFLEVLDALNVQWYAKIMYVSRISPHSKTKPKFPFWFIVIKKVDFLDRMTYSRFL